MKAAGYSGTPLFKKLGIKVGQRAWFSGAPEGYEDELQRAGGIQLANKLEKDLDFLHFFADSRKSLTQKFPRLRDSMTPAGTLWISWPKKSSGKATDLDENIVRHIGLKAGLVDVKVCAVDDTWSALKFVFRLEDR
jgi:hypothetical protein